MTALEYLYLQLNDNLSTSQNYSIDRTENALTFWTKPQIKSTSNALKIGCHFDPMEQLALESITGYPPHSESSINVYKIVSS